MIDVAVRQFDNIEATLQPARTDDLVAGMEAWIGRRFRFQAAWIIEEGPYKRQWAWQLLREDEGQPCPPLTWVPSCDLSDAIELE